MPVDSMQTNCMNLHSQYLSFHYKLLCNIVSFVTAWRRLGKVTAGQLSPRV